MGKRGFERVSCDACFRRKVRCIVLAESELQCTTCRRRGEICTFSTQPPPRKYRSVSATISSPASANKGRTSIPTLTLAPATSNCAPFDDQVDHLRHGFSSFLQQPLSLEHDPFDPGLINETDYMSLIAAYLTIPTTPIPSTSSAVHLTRSEEETALSRFLDRESIIPDIIQPIWNSRRNQSESDADNPWKDLMRKAMVCSGLADDTGLIGPRIQTLVKDILDSIKSLLEQRGQIIRIEIEALCTLVIMSEIWPTAPTDESLHDDILSINPRSVEGMARVCGTFLAQITNTGIPPEWEILHWYVYVIDAMHAADKGLSPHLRRMPSRGPLEESYGKTAADSFLDLAALGRAIGETMELRQIVDATEFAGVIESVRRLQPHSSTIDTFGPHTKEHRLMVVMTILGKHCALALEAHLPKMATSGTNIQMFPVRRLAQAAAASAWHDIVVMLESQRAVSPTSIRISSAIMEIGVGCLFWGIGEAHQALRLNYRDDLLQLLSGSKRLMAVLEYQIQHRPDLVHRLEAMKGDLQHLSGQMAPIQ